MKSCILGTAEATLYYFFLKAHISFEANIAEKKINRAKPQSFFFSFLMWNHRSGSSFPNELIKKNKKNQYFIYYIIFLLLLLTLSLKIIHLMHSGLQNQKFKLPVCLSVPILLPAYIEDR